MDQTTTESLKILSPQEAIQELLKALEETNEELIYLFESDVITWKQYLKGLNEYSQIVASFIETIRREEYVKNYGTQSNDDGDRLPYIS